MKGRYVYFVRPVGMSGPIKIGCSVVPTDRLKAFMSWSPFDLELLVTIPGGRDLEKNIHECFADLHLRHEWFVADRRLSAAIDALVAGLPVDKAIDLSKRAGTIKKAKQGASGWSAHTRLYMSLLHRIRFAAARARKATGRDLRCLKAADEALLESIRRGKLTPTPEVLARFDEIITHPEQHLVTWQELRAPITEKAA
jgi:hypothetical protein